MAEVEKLMGVSAGDIEKIMGVSTDDIEEIMGLEFPAGVLAYQGLTNYLIAGHGTAASADADSEEVFILATTSTGTASDAGDLGTAREAHFVGGSNVSNGNRIVLGGGETNVGGWSNFKDIDYFTPASYSGGSSSFGDLTGSYSKNCAGISNGTIAISAMGYKGSNVDHLDRITIASTGNASDVGDATVTGNGPSGTSTLSRGIHAAGFIYAGGAYYRNDIGYIDMTSPGDASDFGDLTDKSNFGSSSCPSTESRVILRWGGYGMEGTSGSTAASEIDYVNPTSTANSSDFGDQNVQRRYPAATSSDNIRGQRFGGGNSGGSDDTNSGECEYITIASTGNASTMNDLPHHKRAAAGWSA